MDIAPFFYSIKLYNTCTCINKKRLEQVVDTCITVCMIDPFIAEGDQLLTRI